MLNTDHKFYFARLMGEILRIEKRISPEMVNHSDDVIFGLINGIEPVIDEFFPVRNDSYRPIISSEEYSKFCDIMDECKQMGNDFKGYYDVEDKHHFNRGKASTILNYFNLADLYPDVRKKMNTTHSPVEIRAATIIKDKEV
jgi:hypothetical protein